MSRLVFSLQIMGEITDVKSIGVFDSGVGGLTVAAAIKKILPNEKIIYLGDLLHLPYGSKSEEAILEFTTAAVDFLTGQDIKILVIACNTSTSVALEYVRSMVEIPVIGVINPGAERAIKVTNTKRVGVIGTRRTIESGAYRREIESFDRDVKVFQKATPILVPLIEEGWKDHPVMDQVLKEYLGEFEDIEVDTVVLGCTHYPLIKDKIKRIMGSASVIDSAETTAERVKEVLASSGNLSNNKPDVDYLIYLTDYTKSFEELAEVIIGRGTKKIEIVSLKYNRGKIEYNLM